MIHAKIYQSWGVSLIGSWHIATGYLMMNYPEVWNVSSLHVYRSGWESWLFIVGGGLAVSSTFVNREFIRKLMLVTQQYLLLATAAGVLVIIAWGQYPDGTTSPTITRSFLFADQGIYGVICLIHLLFFARTE